MQAALRVFASKGVAATNISDIAAAANLSYGSVYHYFHDKDELYYSLVERALQGSLALVTDVAKRAGTAWERLRALCVEMIEGAQATPEYYLIILQALINEPSTSATYTLAQRYGEQILAHLVEAIQAAQDEGAVVQSDPRELASTLIAILQGATLNQSFYKQAQIPIFAHPSIATVLRILRRPSIPTEEN
jgi:AcrR family transcriptional regulator